MDQLDIGSDCLLIWDDPHDASSGDLITDCVITVTVYAPDDAEVAEATADYSDENQRYEAVLTAADLSSLVEGYIYTAHWRATGGATAERKVRYVASYRGAC